MEDQFAGELLDLGKEVESAPGESALGENGLGEGGPDENGQGGMDFDRAKDLGQGQGGGISPRPRAIAFLIISAAALLLALLIGPLDFFTHGYYYDEFDVEAAGDDLGEPASLDGGVAIRFSPVKRHMAGFEVYLSKNEGGAGILHARIADAAGGVLDELEMPLSDIPEGSWYKVYAGKKCRSGEEYLLSLWAEGDAGSAAIATIHPAYLGGEALEGDAAVVFAYEEPTLGIGEKAFFILFILAAWLFACARLIPLREKLRGIFLGASLFLLMACTLSWSYLFDSFESENEGFTSSLMGSDSLVTGAIEADRSGVGTPEYGGMHYGLEKYKTAAGTHYSLGNPFHSDENFTDGYSKTDASVLLEYGKYTKTYMKKAAAMRFASGDVLPITSCEFDGTFMHVYLGAADGPLNPDRYGSLGDMRLVAEDGSLLPPGYATSYDSQFGLQGWAFRLLSKALGDDPYPALYLLCALLTAATLTAICFLLRKKMGLLYAAVSFLVFLLSPWIAKFARNLYWVEFTWFLPMLVGLYCSMGICSRRRRIFCYAAAFATVAIKCLCGYEYASSVMLGLIAFPLCDLAMALIERDKKRARRLFSATFFLGIFALLGFSAAIMLHASLKGDGDVLAGIGTIIREDVLRRTYGGNMNEYDPVLWDSFNASVWGTLCKYFHFETDIISGVPGSLFPLLCCIPLALFFYDKKRGRLDWRPVALYAVFFCVAASWLVLAKAHSFIHTHMNYVVWYMGFVQACIYIIARWICKNLGKKRE